MRFLHVITLIAIPLAAQVPAVTLLNLSRPSSSSFQVGDRFQVSIQATPNQPISLRTARQGQTNWGPIIGKTDYAGRWSATGQFEKADFGDWTEVWTVGGIFAEPALYFSVAAPCRPGGRNVSIMSGTHQAVSCLTADGEQTFSTPSQTDSFRTRDGRTIAGRDRGQLNAEQYRAEILEWQIGNGTKSLHSSGRGDADGALIRQLIGINSLSPGETRNVLAIARSAFQMPDRIPQEAKNPVETLALLRTLSTSTRDENLKRDIAQTIVFIQDH